MTAVETKLTPFLPAPLDDAWSRWLVGDWEGVGQSDTGRGRGVDHIEFALNGQFLISRGEARVSEITPDEADYLRRNMHASDDEIRHFQAASYRSLEIFTLEPDTGEVVAFSFDSLRCVAIGHGRREPDREEIEWRWTNGRTSTRVTQRLDESHLRVTQRTPMPDGSMMEETSEAVRRGAGSDSAMRTETSATTAVHAFIAAINAHDVAAIRALMTADHTFIDSAGSVVIGRDPMTTGWKNYLALYPDYLIQIETVVRNDDVVAIFGSWSATYAGRETARWARVGGPAAWKAQIEAGGIKTWQVYADHTRTLEAMRQADEAAQRDAP